MSRGFILLGGFSFTSSPRPHTIDGRNFANRHCELIFKKPIIEMPASEYGPQLNFLRGSASSLSAASPSTAAHLMSVHNRILHDDFRSLNHRQQEASCGACGTVRNPGTSKTIQIKPNRSKRASSSSEGTTIYQCLRCRRRAVKSCRKEPARPKVSKANTRALGPSTATSQSPANGLVAQQPAPELLDATRATKTTENANSKKRAKARKQGGLQALLVSKQQSQPASSSLDLFDFLQ